MYATHQACKLFGGDLRLGRGRRQQLAQQIDVACLGRIVQGAAGKRSRRGERQ
jgi:hypothetical protein